MAVEEEVEEEDEVEGLEEELVEEEEGMVEEEVEEVEVEAVEVEAVEVDEVEVEAVEVEEDEVQEDEPVDEDEADDEVLMVVVVVVVVCDVLVVEVVEVATRCAILSASRLSWPTTSTPLMRTLWRWRSAVAMCRWPCWSVPSSGSAMLFCPSAIPAKRSRARSTRATAVGILNDSRAASDGQVDTSKGPRT